MSIKDLSIADFCATYNYSPNELAQLVIDNRVSEIELDETISKKKHNQ